MGFAVMKGHPRRLIFIGAVWLLLVFGCWFLMVTRPGIEISWKQETTPPEPVSRLKIEESGRILAETSGGNAYEFIEGLNPPWVKVTEAIESSEPDMNCDISDPSGYLILSPPGNVASRVSQHCLASESGFHLELVLLENGEIWFWRHETNQTLWVLLLGCALLLGIPLLGLAGVAYQQLKRN